MLSKKKIFQKDCTFIRNKLNVSIPLLHLNQNITEKFVQHYKYSFNTVQDMVKHKIEIIT